MIQVVQIPDGDVEMEDIGAAASAPSQPSTSALQIGGFNWGNKPQPDDVDDISDSDDSDSGEQQHRKKKRKKHEIEQDLTADMHNRAPESTSDFERLLLGSPNSSYLWVQYMSFQMQLSEVEKAREVGRRALKVINFREEQEKLNVWIALLNLENMHGTAESLEALFKDAARHNEAKTVYLRMASIFEQTDKLEVCELTLAAVHELTTLQQAEEQFQKTTKKFGKSSKVWTNFAEFYLKHDRPDDARKLLARCVQSLEKRKRAYCPSVLAGTHLTAASQTSRRSPNLHSLSTVLASPSAVGRSLRALSHRIQSATTYGLSTSTWRRDRRTSATFGAERFQFTLPKRLTCHLQQYLRACAYA